MVASLTELDAVARASSTELVAVRRAPQDAVTFKTVFDVRDIELRPALKEKIAVIFLRYPGVMRWLFPLLKIGGYWLVTRNDDVKEVMGRHDVFHMGLADKMRRLTGGPNFILAMDDGPEYRRILGYLMNAFRREDVADIVAPFCERLSRQIVQRSHGRLDVMQDLVTHVPARVCERYFGIRLHGDDQVAFSHWTFAISQYLFLGLDDVPRFRRAALAGAERIRAVIDAAISDAKREHARRAAAARLIEIRREAAEHTLDRIVEDIWHRIVRRGLPSNAAREIVLQVVEYEQRAPGVPVAASPPVQDDTVLSRLIDMQATGAPGLTDDVIRACLMGTISGFVPTNTLTAGHLLQYVLRKRDVKLAAQLAAQSDDDEKLKRVLFEASRFEPTLVGRFRVCAEDVAIAVGSGHEKEIKRGEHLLVSTLSAMFDYRRVNKPRVFNPDRERTDYLLFGHGLHACLGLHIAEAQITQTLKPLLMKKGLRPARGSAGRLKDIGNFPQHLIVEFDTD